MGNQAKVLDPGIFDELKAALTKFESEAGDSIRSAERAIQETRNWLEERFGHWNSEVNRRKQELQHAQDALKRCQSSAQSSNEKGKKEQQKDCSAEAQEVFRAKRALEQAEANLRIAKKWRGDFANIEHNFRVKVQNFKQSLNIQINQSSKSLLSYKQEVERYIGAGGASSKSTMEKKLDEQQVQKNLPSQLRDINSIFEVEPYVEQMLNQSGSLKNNSRALGEKLENEFGIERPEGYDAHHIIPSSVAEDMEIMQVASLLGYDINNVNNGIFLPGDLGIAKETRETYHSNLQAYNEYAKANLEVIQETFKRIYAGNETLDNKAKFLRDNGYDKTLLMNIVNLQNQMRLELTNKNLLLTTKDPSFLPEQANVLIGRVNQNNKFVGSLAKVDSAIAGKLQKK